MPDTSAEGDPEAEEQTTLEGEQTLRSRSDPLDPALNESAMEDDRDLSASWATVRRFLIRSREELMIAAAVRAAIG